MTVSGSWAMTVNRIRAARYRGLGRNKNGSSLVTLPSLCLLFKLGLISLQSSLQVLEERF